VIPARPLPAMSQALLRPTLRQAFVVALAGVAIGLVANALSPRGLSLSRNYFPDTPAFRAAATAAPAATATATAAPAGTNPAATAPARSQRGLPLIGQERATELFRDPRRTEGLILFVDARAPEPYARGHIPGAYPLDHYRLELYVTDLIGVAHLAQEIVVYCHGGECEDSDLAASDLQQLGVPASKFSIYRGGFDEWQRLKLPVETGARGSGARANP